MWIYGEDYTFVKSMTEYMGDDLSQKYIKEIKKNNNIFIKNTSEFNIKWGKGFNKIICSILRAYIDAYDEKLMNKAYLEQEEELDKIGRVYQFANAFKDLKQLYEILDGHMFIIKIDCPCCFICTIL
jgi:hypothetical protein